MPNVFVVPPEEDQRPTWCFFDATKEPPVEPELSTVLDVDVLESALDALHTEAHAPFHRDAAGPFGTQNTVIMPRGIDAKSITDVLMNHDYLDTDDEMEMEGGHELVRGVTMDGTGNDSEIVEVVKVGRNAKRRGVPTDTEVARVKSSKSLKSRASKAFRTIRNVGRGSVRSKPKAQDIFDSTNEMGCEPPLRAKTPTMSRRSSVILSQLFTGPGNSKTRPSAPSFEPRSINNHPVEESPPASPSSSHHHVPMTSPTSPPPLDFLDPSSPSSSHQDFDHHQDIRSPSPTPSTQTFSTRRRFSVMSLQRLFSFSSSNSAVETSNFGPEPVIPRSAPSMSHDSTGPSTISSSGPNTPVDDVTQLPLPPHLQLRLSLDSDDGLISTHPKPEPTVSPITPVTRADVSFEMRLDSLHFDSLSFDADRF